jgi:valyl-tRNA synthetase
MARLDRLQREYADALGAYSFNHAAQLLYDFFRGDYCDRFLEAAKTDLASGAQSGARLAVLGTIDRVFGRYLQLLHPYMPHVTEELWSTMGYARDGAFLTLTPLEEQPLLQGVAADRIEAAQRAAEAVYETAARIRNLKAACGLPARRDLIFILKPAGAVAERDLVTLGVLAGAGTIRLEPEHVKARNTAGTLTPLGEVYLPLEGLIDLEAEQLRLGKELERVQSEVAKVDAKLASESFVSRAPVEVVEEHRQRRADWLIQSSQLEEMLRNLEG